MKYRMDQKVSEAAREAKNAYAREWRARNKDRVREYNASYWQRKAEQNEQKSTKEGC